MIPRKLGWIFSALVIALTAAKNQNSRSYDNNDWIPMVNDQQQGTTEKQASGRSLNLAESPNQHNFFPNNAETYKSRQQQNPNGQQYLRQTLLLRPQDIANQRRPVQEQYPNERPPNFIRLRQEPLPSRQPFLLPPPPQQQVQKFQQPQPTPQQYIVQSQKSIQLPVQRIPTQPTLGPQQQQQQLLPNQHQQQQQLLPNQQQQQQLQFLPQFLLPGQNYYNPYQGNYQNLQVNPTQYSIPLNGSVYESLNPGIHTINQELLSTTIRSNKAVLPTVITSTTPKIPEQKESVQLVYVPLESLNQREQANRFRRPQLQPSPSPSPSPTPEIPFQHQQRNEPAEISYESQRNSPLYRGQDLRVTDRKEEQIVPVQRFQDFEATRKQATFPELQVPNSHKQLQLENIEKDFLQQALDAHRLQVQFQQGEQPFIQSTTPKPTRPPTKKRKPHQPPLAVYMESEGHVDVSDVLEALKNAKTIAVQDSIGPNSPHVFVGPNNLEPPEGYTKFELPYLSSIENNRVERKVQHLPFFVAPLSYRAPPGYSKIPLPSPHVGSVVISTNGPDVPSTTPTPITFEQQPYRFSTILGTPEAYPSPQTNLYENNRGNSLEHQQEIDEISRFIGQTANQLQNRFINTNVPINQVPNQVRITPSAETISDPNEIRYPGTQPPFPTISEIPQTNRQFITNFRYPETTPLIQNYEVDTPTTTRTKENKLFSLQRTTQKPVISTQTSFESDEDKYTVLEDFAVKQKASTPKYESNEQTEGSIGPRYYYNLNPQIQPAYTKELNQKPINQFNSDLERYFQNQPFDNRANKIKLENQKIRDDYEEQTTTIKSNERPFNILKQQIVEQTESPELANRANINFHQVEEERDSQEQQDSESPQHSNYHLPAELPPISPLLPGLINNLQDKSIRPLLVPGLLVPTTKEVPRTTPQYEVQTFPSTEAITTQPNTKAPVYTTQVPVETTTPYKRPRGRQRGGSRYNSGTTSTSIPRRTQRTRRPHTRTQVEHSSRHNENNEASSTDYTPVRIRDYENQDSTRRSPAQRQRFRTRGRPVQNDVSVTDRNYESSFEHHRRPTQKQDVHTSPRTNLYSQFEQSIPVDVTKRPNDQDQTTSLIKEFHPVYSIPVETTTETVHESASFGGLVDNRKMEAEDAVLSALNQKTVSETTQNYIRFNANTGGFLDNKSESDATTTSRSTTRGRGRVRGRSRFTTTTTTTTPPPTTTSQKIQSKRQEDEEEEFYGFLRPPNYNQLQQYSISSTTPSPLRLYPSIYQIKELGSEAPSPVYSPEYIGNTQHYPVQYQESIDKALQIQTSSNEEFGPSTQIQYVDNTKPEYYSSNTDEYNIPVTTEATTEAVKYTVPTTTIPTTVKTRIRGRLRVPTRKPAGHLEDSVYTTTENYNNARQSINEIQTTPKVEQLTRRPQRTRSRGRTHFSLPNTIKEKKDDADIEGENYPEPYLRGQTIATKKPAFKITVEPASEEEETYDQLPYSSLYSPSIVSLDDNTREEIELSGQAAALAPIENNLPPEEDDYANTFVETTSLPVITTTEESITISSQDSSHLSEEFKTEISSTTTIAPTTPTTQKLKTRRRGVWKLVRHRPVDTFEAMESQNIQSAMLNTLLSEVKLANHNLGKSAIEKPLTTTEASIDLNNNTTTATVNVTTEATTPTTTEDNLFDTLYEMFGMAQNHKEIPEEVTEAATEATSEETTEFKIVEETISAEETTTATPILPEEIVETTTEMTTKNATTVSTTTTTTTTTTEAVPKTTMLPDTLEIEELPSSNTEESRKYEVEPWQMRVIKTSTSTEISHGAVICYKGRCVKSEERRPIYQ